MKLTIKKAELQANEVAEIFACELIYMELDDISNDGEFAQEFEITKEIHVHDYCKKIELDYSGTFGGIFSDTTGHGEQPTSELLRRFMYDSELKAFIEGEEIEINSNEIIELITKKVNYERKF